eukprot:scaffold23122_cov17-Tisochrysis_lutea.AAC.1
MGFLPKTYGARAERPPTTRGRQHRVLGSDTLEDEALSLSLSALGFPRDLAATPRVTVKTLPPPPPPTARDSSARRYPLARRFAPPSLDSLVIALFPSFS